MGNGYTFGDSGVAADRLAVVAGVFADSSRRLMVQSIPQHADVVLDLGCGPGYTTRLLAETSRARRVVGLDASDGYIALARRLSVDSRIQFRVHDVTRLPLPDAPVDVVYCRFLLSHLQDPTRVVHDWLGQLRPEGIVILDELEAIDAPIGPLRAYVDLAAQVVATAGGSLFVGALLRPFGGQVVELDVPLRTAVRMFRMNLDAWRQTAVEHGLAEDEGVDELGAELGKLGQAGGDVRWSLRQLVIAV